MAERPTAEEVLEQAAGYIDHTESLPALKELRDAGFLVGYRDDPEVVAQVLTEAIYGRLPTNPGFRRSVLSKLPERFPEAAFDDWCIDNLLPRNNRSLWRWLREAAFQDEEPPQ